MFPVITPLLHPYAPTRGSVPRRRSAPPLHQKRRWLLNGVDSWIAKGLVVIGRLLQSREHGALETLRRRSVQRPGGGPRDAAGGPRDVAGVRDV